MVRPSEPEEAPGTDLVDLWLGLITALVIAGGGVAFAFLALFAPAQVGGWRPFVVAAGVGLLLATPLAAAWGTRRPDWQGAGLRAVGVGLVAAVAAAPVVRGVAGLTGLTVTISAVLLAETAGIGASVAAAPRATHAWSLLARGLAVLGVLLAPLAVIAAGELLGPQPSAVARSLWMAAPLGVIPIVGLADSFAYALTARGSRPGPGAD